MSSLDQHDQHDWPNSLFSPQSSADNSHTHALFLSNGSPAPSDHTPSSPEVAKAASARFTACIGGGAILSAEVMLQIMADAEHEVEQSDSKKSREPMSMKVRITQSGTQVDVGNRLLRHFGLPGEVVRYEGGGGEAEGAEQAENDDHEAI